MPAQSQKIYSGASQQVGGVEEYPYLTSDEQYTG
jgi:hypothetical protein